MGPEGFAMTSPSERAAPSNRAGVVGTGLIGGSIGLALKARGWHVTGYDNDPDRAEQAKRTGVIDAVGLDPDAVVTFIATPLNAVTEAVATVFGQAGLRSDAVVSDVAGVKGPVVAAVTESRFVGGHPMAGSEQVGLDGADPELFVGATWVLTPTETTDPGAYSRLQAVVVSLGAEVVALSPDEHDALVAVVSHVPHLTAATLMNLADHKAEKHAALLRLAAGGFRDMTRIAAGQPNIWPDICDDNADAIVKTLDLLVDALRDACTGAGRLGGLPIGRGERDATDPAASRYEELTAREAGVVHLVARGMSNKAIGHDLGISPRTVEGHLNHVFDKLGIGSRTELVHYALAHSLFSREPVSDPRQPDPTPELPGASE